MNSHSPRPRLLGAALVALAVVGTTSACGPNEDETVPSQEKEGVAVGVNAEFASLEAENLLIVASAEGEPGRLLGTLYPIAEEEITVTFADVDDEFTITVDGATSADDSEGYDLQEQEHVFDTAGGRPGGYTDITITVGDESTELGVPVRDGSLEQYAPFVPERSQYAA